MIGDAPQWEREGHDWPNRQASRFVRAGGLEWHVQQAGQGPALLLVHGTGAATHSWRELLPLLTRAFTVVAPDLPGHGFTAMPAEDRLRLPAMASALAELLRVLEVEPAVAVGHSAGAAILVHMSLNGGIAPRRLISLNGALFPLPGVGHQLFPPMARLLSLNPLAPRLLAFGAGRWHTQRMLANTGSRIDPVDVALYTRLFGCPGHVAGALGMMANWDLRELAQALPEVAAPLVLVAADRDRAISPVDARRVMRLVPGAELVRLAELGHLAHEEDPERVAALVVARARDAGVLPTA